ncbi:MAG: polysaccharide deacetylase [Hyphomicrobiaceae bacterium]
MSGLTICLTFDFDGMAGWIGSDRTNNPSMISRGSFATVALPRVLRVLRQAGVPASVAVPGHTVLAFPDLVRAIRDDGHELVHHGWGHENPAEFDEAGERRIIERGIAAFDTAAGVRPIGYRSPAWDLSPITLDLLREYGFVYDSSCMGHDYRAYYLRTGDRWSRTEPYEFGPLTELVELPVYWGLDDYPYFEYTFAGGGGLRDPAEVERIWLAELEHALAHEPGGIFMLTFHPEFIGRGARIQLLERLIARFKSMSGVRFSTMGDYARQWKAANPLEAWARLNPHFAGMTAIKP